MKTEVEKGLASHSSNKDTQHFMENSNSSMNNRLNPLKKIIFPLVDKLQVHLDIFPELAKDEKKLADSGFIVFNLCLNAQTFEKHTKCDAPYTVISVPNQLSKKHLQKKKGKFEINRLQIHNENDEKPPFVNIISYNSKHLFENILESFRRFLGKKY